MHLTMAPRILVVEDNPDNQLLTSEVLDRDGFIVDVAESSSAVMQSLGAHLPDLILMDIQLAGEDGLALTRQLKARPSTAPIPIVTLTAHAMAGQEQQATAAGCAGYITKPIDTRTFARLVKAFLEARMPPVESANGSVQEANSA